MALMQAAVPRVTRRPVGLRWIFPTLSFITDLILVNVAFGLAYWLRYKYGLGGFGVGFKYIPLIQWSQFQLLLTLVIPSSFALAGVYRQRLGSDWMDSTFAIARAATVGMALTIIVTFLFKNVIDQYSRLVLLYSWVMIIAVCATGRAFTRMLMVQLYRRGLNVKRVVVAGSTSVGKMVMQNLSSRVDQGYRLIGFLHENGGAPESFGRFCNLGPVANAGETLSRYDVDEVVIALSSTSHKDIMDIRDHCERQNVAFKIVPDLFEMSLARVRMDEIAGIPLIDVVSSPLRGTNLLLKRFIDVTFALCGLIILSPILVLVAIAVRLDSPGQVIISQPRVGRFGQEFPFLKFRSMYQGAEGQHAEIAAHVGADQPMVKHRSDPRRTRVGRVIRKLSIDELPQLLNVLRGEMSLVGPRPALPVEVARYESWHHKRFDVQPGMTGLWQVSGRSNLDFNEMVMMDIYYIDNWSPALDLKILFRTPAAVVTMRGAY